MYNPHKACSVTTYQAHFLQHGEVKSPIISKSQVNSDMELISGHIGNNLRCNGQPLKSKIWPELLNEAENYEDFLKHLEYSNKDIFDLYFKCSSIDKKIVEKMLKNVNKTAYQLAFSSQIFTSCNERRRFARLASDGLYDCMKYEPTTYRTYFSRIEEMKQLKDVLKGTVLKENKEDLINDLKKIRHCRRTTYHDEMSVLAKLYAKPTLLGPIDRYTMRKI